MPDVVNLQRKVKLDTAAYKKFVAELTASVSEANSNDFTVAFIGDGRMKQLNEIFRGKNTTTDVLSFPHQPDEFDSENKNLGDIVISADQAQKQSTENGLSLDAEIKQLILHGLLHLCGHDHETDNGEMNRRELALRKQLSI